MVASADKYLLHSLTGNNVSVSLHFKTGMDAEVEAQVESIAAAAFNGSVSRWKALANT
jgi:hypothetical protein